jgi:hypothetical protein
MISQDKVGSLVMFAQQGLDAKQYFEAEDASYSSTV